jgi:hypothetical protein
VAAFIFKMRESTHHAIMCCYHLEASHTVIHSRENFKLMLKLSWCTNTHLVKNGSDHKFRVKYVNIYSNRIVKWNRHARLCRCPLWHPKTMKLRSKTSSSSSSGSTTSIIECFGDQRLQL